jgi:uncharacterized protein (DUF3084 family)
MVSPLDTYNTDRPKLDDCPQCKVIGALCEFHLRKEIHTLRTQLETLQRQYDALEQVYKEAGDKAVLEHFAVIHERDNAREVASQWRDLSKTIAQACDIDTDLPWENDE